ncbi:MAG: GDP-L-fucose synthase family protein [Gemmatimonadaceae bacterium]
MPKSRIFVAGHRGLVGSALVRELSARGHESLITRGRDELDLRDQGAVRGFFEKERPEVLFLAAAKVGGIHANNTSRWEFLRENLSIQDNVIGAAFDSGVDRLVFFGSSCIYPKHAEQPIREEFLLTGSLEQTNEPYAIAKIAGLKLVEAANTQYGKKWLSIMPTNLYGPGDNFDLDSSHVLPAMIRKFHEAKAASGKVRLWGTGSPRREFLHVDDLARASCDLLEGGFTGLYNVGYGSDVTIRELAGLVAKTVGFDGEVEWDSTRPDGTPRKLLDSGRVRETGWSPAITLEEGLGTSYDWYVSRGEAVSRL